MCVCGPGALDVASLMLQAGIGESVWRAECIDLNYCSDGGDCHAVSREFFFIIIISFHYFGIIFTYYLFDYYLFSYYSFLFFYSTFLFSFINFTFLSFIFLLLF